MIKYGNGGKKNRLDLCEVRVHDDDGAGCGCLGEGGVIVHPKYSDQKIIIWQKNAQQMQSLRHMHNIDTLCMYLRVCVSVCNKIHIIVSTMDIVLGIWYIVLYLYTYIDQTYR